MVLSVSRREHVGREPSQSLHRMATPIGLGGGVDIARLQHPENVALHATLLQLVGGARGTCSTVWSIFRPCRPYWIGERTGGSSANLAYAISASIDGYIADEKGRLRLDSPVRRSAYLLRRSATIGRHLPLRTSHVRDKRVWDSFLLDDLPAVQRDFAEAWQATDKIVHSSTLDSVSEPRIRLERKFDPGVVETMKDGTDRESSRSISTRRSAVRAMR